MVICLYSIVETQIKTKTFDFELHFIQTYSQSFIVLQPFVQTQQKNSLVKCPLPIRSVNSVQHIHTYSYLNYYFIS